MPDILETAAASEAEVAHGRFLRILLASLMEEEYGLERMHELGHANTCVNHLVVRGGQCEARLLNCTAHLGDADGGQRTADGDPSREGRG